MTTKQNMETAIALVQQAQVIQGQKIDKIDLNINKIMEARYVTQNEMQLAITAATKEISDKVDFLTKILSIVGGTILLAFLGAIIKLVFIK